MTRLRFEVKDSQCGRLSQLIGQASGNLNLFPFYPFISFVLDCHKFSGEFSGAPLICRKATELTFSFHFTFPNIFICLKCSCCFFSENQFNESIEFIEDFQQISFYKFSPIFLHFYQSFVENFYHSLTRVFSNLFLRKIFKEILPFFRRILFCLEKVFPLIFQKILFNFC